MIELDGKVALVTGAAGGIGAATAARLATAGAQVVLADINLAGAQATVDTITGNNAAASCVPLALDVRDPQAWAAVIEHVVERFGGLQIVHLNAGLMSRGADEPLTGPLDVLTHANYARVMQVNVDGVMFGLLAALPHLQTDGGDVVITASTAGLTGLSIDPFYALSKHALVGLVRSLAGLTEHGVRVNAVCPGGTDTAIVPTALRPHISLSPPEYIADAVMEIIGSGRGGQVWLAPGHDRGTWVVPDPTFTPP